MKFKKKRLVLVQIGEIKLLNEKLEKMFLKHGFNDFKWINPKKIVVSYWVRMKCMYGCPEYGKGASCPPNVPSVDECQKFILEYEKAVVFHFSKAFTNPDDRHKWGQNININLLEIERDVFLSGHVKAFLMLSNTCQLCQECTSNRETCIYKRKSRPTVEAMAVDVYSTVRQLDYPIQVLKDLTETMNRYAILLIE